MSLNYSTVALLVDPDVKTIGVRFDPFSGKTYTYKTKEDFSIGDYAVVVVSKTPKVVKVVELGPPTRDDGIEYKWAVGRVDFTNYLENRSMERELQAKISKLETSHKRRQILDALGVVDLPALTFK